jgi:hypothetical protein
VNGSTGARITLPAGREDRLQNVPALRLHRLDRAQKRVWKYRIVTAHSLEDGKLAIVSATPDRFTKIARLQAISVKTCHPALVGHILLVHKSEELAELWLAVASR